MTYGQLSPDTSFSPAVKEQVPHPIPEHDQEKIVRAELWRRGYRYRLNDKRLPSKHDLVLPKYRDVIFINGCFWHDHRGCPKYVRPKTNAGFWKEKIARIEAV